MAVAKGSRGKNAVRRDEWRIRASCIHKRVQSIKVHYGYTPGEDRFPFAIAMPISVGSIEGCVEV